ncbi:SRPBCC family protein [Nocardioides marmoribigeumensis]|uniref:Carbon monoxide dehydrogenase subunit G n=1 Tax=Nocardioides marmoribigeumensis TaxID=433649 RepID=A0ABU2BZB1_9ACTN|nr:SRPBCC family protein [Nocardioides marmoribigeumensis]MDR7363751.1 carbon monoxide dehydrogenase subunit G [Nocardioides marmoribigeumensis]
MRLEEQIVVAAPPEKVWDVVADPCRIGRLGDRFIVEELAPDTVPGPGARYRVLLKVGAVPVGGNVEVIEHLPPRELTWTTITGVDHRLRLRLRPHGDGTRVVLRFAYDSPGLLGTAADLAAYLPVRRALRELLESVAEQVG